MSFFESCKNDPEACRTEAITFLAQCRKFPKRWQIIKSNTGNSIHGLSSTRWSSKVKAISPLKKNLPDIITILESCKSMKMKDTIKTDLNGIIKYLQSFEFQLMTCILFRILEPIDCRSNLRQARYDSVDVEVDNFFKVSFRI